VCSSDLKGPYTFMLDTGSNSVLVSQRISDELGLKEWQAACLPVKGATKKRWSRTTWARVESLKLGKLKLEQFDVHVSVADCFTGQDRYDGILGINVLKQWVLTIDYPAKQVTIAKGQLPAPDNQTAFNYKAKNMTPNISITIGDHTKWMLIDTGSAGAFSVPTGWEKQIHFIGNPNTVRIFGIIGTAEGFAGRVSDKISFGAYSFTEPTVSVGGIGFRVGGSVLKHFRITLDQKKKIIRFESQKHFPMKLSPRSWARAKNWPSCVKDWISEGHEVDATDQGGYTALFRAAYQGHVDAVTQLLEAGGDVNFTDPNGVTPLITAADAGHEDMLKLLLNNGADISIKTVYDQDALFFSAGNGHVGCTSLLLSRGANVETQDKQGATVLMAATQRGHLKIVKLLLDAGADISIKSVYDQDALFISAVKGHVDCISLLISNGAKVETQNKQGITALMAAAWKGHEKIVRVLLEAGANPNHMDNKKQSVLMAAAFKGHLKIARMLVDKDANINLSDNDNYTPLMVAAKGGHIKIVKFLLEKGADPSTKDADGKTALGYAKEKKHDAVAQLLAKIAGT